MLKKYFIAFALLGCIALTAAIICPQKHSTQTEYQELALSGGGFLTIENIERLG